MRTDTHTQKHEGRNPLRKLRPATVIRWTLMATSVVFMARLVRTGWGDIAEAVKMLATTKSTYVVIAIALEVAWTFCLAQVYRTALMAMGGVARKRAAVRVSMGAFTLSRILPGGGAVGSVFAARELMALGNPGTLTIASMIVSWWVSMTTLSSIVFGGVAVAVGAGVVAPSYLLAPAFTLAAMIVIGAGFVIAIRRPRWRARLQALFAKALGRSGVDTPEGAEKDNLEAAVAGLRGGRRLLIVSWWAAASWILDAAALWVIFDAFGHRLSIGALLIGYGLANLLQALPELTPGWLGVLETAMSVTYTAFGIPAGVAVVAVLSYRLLSYWLPVAAGLPSAIQILRRSGRRAPAVLSAEGSAA